MQICLFEDDAVSNLAPLNYLRHTSELICGVHSLKEKVQALTKNKFGVSLYSRSYLQNLLDEKFPQKSVPAGKENYLFLNSRIIFDKASAKFLLVEAKQNKLFAAGESFWIDDTCIAFTASVGTETIDLGSIIHSEKVSVKNKKEFFGVKIINYPSDLISLMDDEFISEIDTLIKSKGKSKKKTKAELINKKNIYVSPKANISSFAVLDAANGGIYISDDVTIEPFSYIKGPVFIGKKTLIRASSKLYGTLRIGEQCKLGGEISHSILHSFVNKQHHGFTGHSYICEWVNLGAGTTTSNLKNNYSHIAVKNKNGTVDTKSIFLGSLIGDHTKTGISSMLNTGSMIGISCNIFGSGYQSKLIPSFSWADNDSKQTVSYEIEKAIHTARISMKRRGLEMSDAYEKTLRYLFTQKENLLV